MKNSVNYLKFDFRIVQKNIKHFLIPLIPFIIFMISGDSYIFGMSYLFLFIFILSAMPFNIQGNEKSNEMYYMFPAKISSMVLGRFLYLICTTLIIFIVNGIIMACLYNMNKLQNFEVLATCLSGIVSLLICFIQYPLYYKVGIENGRIISIIIYIIPAVIVFMLPNYFKENNLFTNLIFCKDNISIIILFSLLTVIFIGYISYLISYRICNKKEVK